MTRPAHATNPRVKSKISLGEARGGLGLSVMMVQLTMSMSSPTSSSLLPCRRADGLDLDYSGIGLL